MKASAGATGMFGFAAGHLSGVVGCDFFTGRTGIGAMFTTGAAVVVVVGGAAVVDLVDRAGWRVD